MDILHLMLFILAGAGVGFAVGITGIGGGSLMTPLLLLFGFPANIAIGTDLLYAAITKSGGVVVHKRQGTIRWNIVLRLAAGSVPATLVTLYILKNFITDQDVYQQILTNSLGTMLIITSLVLFFRDKIQGRGEIAPNRFQQWRRRHTTALTISMGVVLGIFVTLSSVGAGAFGAAVLMTLYPRLPTIHIIGTDLAHAIPLTLIAGTGHLYLGNVDFYLLGSLLIGSLPAIYVGSKVGAKLPDKILQKILATILMILGLKYALF